MKVANTRDIEMSIMKEFHQRRCMPIAPSIVLPHGWEADVAALTKTGFCHEFEIKVSRSDFLADFAKGGYHGDKRNKHERMKARIHEKGCWIPNYFWFCSPIGVLKETDIPDYAGWFEIEFIETDWHYYKSSLMVARERKRALRLHKNKTDSQFLQTAFLMRLTNIVTHGRGGNFDAVPPKIEIEEIQINQLSLF